ncbi:unnamed protein product, partial [Ixodes hexagonus]
RFTRVSPERRDHVDAGEAVHFQDDGLGERQVVPGEDRAELVLRRQHRVHLGTDPVLNLRVTGDQLERPAQQRRRARRAGQQKVQADGLEPVDWAHTFNNISLTGEGASVQAAFLHGPPSLVQIDVHVVPQLGVVQAALVVCHQSVHKGVEVPLEALQLGKARAQLDRSPEVGQVVVKERRRSVHQAGETRQVAVSFAPVLFRRVIIRVPVHVEQQAGQHRHHGLVQHRFRVHGLPQSAVQTSHEPLRHLPHPVLDAELAEAEITQGVEHEAPMLGPLLALALRN